MPKAWLNISIMSPTAKHEQAADELGSTLGSMTQQTPLQHAIGTLWMLG